MICFLEINFILLHITEIQIIKSSSVIESFTELYRNINNYQDENKEISIQHGQLKPKLRKYQIDAVRWMMTRELALPENGKYVTNI